MPSKQQIEEARTQNYQRLCETLAGKGYTQESAVISIVKANVMALVTAVPFIIIFVVLYWLLYGEFGWVSIGVILLWFVSIPVHELLHGIGWLPSCKNGWKQSIHFGMMWSVLTPYCHCSEALSVGRYYAGLLMPFMVLGILPSVASLVIGSESLLWFGAYNILLAGGDTTIASVLFRYIGKKAKLIDHPTECGCAVFLKS